MSEENRRIWGAGVGGWGAKDRRLNYREKFWVDGENQILLTKVILSRLRPSYILSFKRLTAADKAK